MITVTPSAVALLSRPPDPFQSPLVLPLHRSLLYLQHTLNQSFRTLRLHLLRPLQSRFPLLRRIPRCRPTRR